jgi:coatomer subunit gamma
MSMFATLDKSIVLQEARIFNETPVKASKCCVTLTKVLYLIYQGIELTTTEATKLFFDITKLFQSKDVFIPPCLFLL